MTQGHTPPLETIVAHSSTSAASNQTELIGRFITSPLPCQRGYYSAETKRQYRGILTTIASELEDGITLLTATKEQIMATIALSGKPAQTHTLAALNSFFKFCKRNSISFTAENLPKTKYVLPHSFYTPQEHLDTVLETMTGNSGLIARDRAVLALAYGMGLKIGELRTLQPEQLKKVEIPSTHFTGLTGDWKFYEYTPAPTKEPRIIPVQPIYAEEYERYRRNAEEGIKLFRGIRQYQNCARLSLSPKALQRTIDKHLQKKRGGRTYPQDNSRTLRNGYIRLLLNAHAQVKDVVHAIGNEMSEGGHRLRITTYQTTHAA